MPRITFDYNNEKTQRLDTDRNWSDRGSRHDWSEHVQRQTPFRDTWVSRTDDRSIQKRSFCPNRNNNAPGPNVKKNDFPIWAATALFSLLGIFAIFTPICTFSLELFEIPFNVSFTGIDLFRMAFNDRAYMIDENKFKVYIITIAGFVASLASSLILKERIAEKPYISVAAGLAAIAGIVIPFGFDAVKSIIVEGHGICMPVQLVCALMLILVNFASLKNKLSKMSSSVPQRKSF